VKVVGLRETKQALSEYVDAAQTERILITRHGRPAALLVGVEGLEMAALFDAAGGDFWKVVEKRRRGTGRRAAESGARAGKRRSTTPRAAR
jgi:prevent-host-death family protein